jgi:hypothetical protein
MASGLPLSRNCGIRGVMRPAKTGTARRLLALVSFSVLFHWSQPDRTPHDWPDSTSDLTCENRTRQALPDGGPIPSKQQVAGSSPARTPEIRSTAGTDQA